MTEQDNYKYLERGYPAGELYKVLLISRRENILETIQGFRSYENAGTNPPEHIIKAKVQTLFLDLDAHLQKFCKDEAFAKLEKQVYHEDVEEVIKAFRVISKLLLDIGITMLTMSREVNMGISKKTKYSGGWE